jgi:hypothetical protein
MMQYSPEYSRMNGHVLARLSLLLRSPHKTNQSARRGSPEPAETLDRRFPPYLVLCGFLSFAGCGPTTTTSPPAEQAVTSEDAPEQQTFAKIVASPDRETWDVIFIEDTKVGYAHTRYGATELDGTPVEHISSTQQMKINRFGQNVTIETRFASWETDRGQMLRCFSEMDDGSAKTIVRGDVRGEELVLTTETAGKTTANSIPWDPSWGGFFASEQILEREPMQPGERRSFKTLMPILNQIGDVELEATARERTDLLNQAAELLRIEGKIRLGGATIKSIIWTDAHGQTRKTFLPAMNQVTYRTTKDIALQQGPPGEFDLGFDMIVKVDRPIPQPHQTREVVYRATLERGDPSGVFAVGRTQAVRRIDDHTAEITVRALPPDSPLEEYPVDSLPTELELASSNYLQTDDETVVSMAQAVAANETDAWQIACALEKHVHESIQSKNFSQAMATAADVAASLEGDCTEHAVLLAALCRVREIPARIAIGLVYFSQVQGFAYHMWTEVWIDDRWIPLDATLGRGGIGAAHLKIRHSSLEGTDALSAFLPVLDLMGKLQLQVEARDPK